VSALGQDNATVHIRDAGDLTDDSKLHDEGVADELEVKTQDAFGRAKRRVGEAIESIGKTVKK
jgi:uncharacterized protein YjbJ (UPF0337 family)